MTPAEPWQWAFTIGLYVVLYIIIGIGTGWLIKAIQLTIMLAVAGSNIIWHWTPNGYMVGILAIGAAWALTVPPVVILDRFRRKRAARSKGIVKRQQSTELDF